MKNEKDLENIGNNIYQSATLGNIVRTFKQNLESYIEFQTINAKLMRAKYDALIAEGFDKDQAERIIKETKLI